MRLPIVRDACATARKLIADGLDPTELLEFVRDDVVCLRASAGAFARSMVAEGPNGPRHVPYRAFDPAVRARLGKPVAPPMRRKRRPARLIVQD
jgi:hypothetical protein